MKRGVTVDHTPARIHRLRYLAQEPPPSTIHGPHHLSNTTPPPDHSSEKSSSHTSNAPAPRSPASLLSHPSLFVPLNLLCLPLTRTLVPAAALALVVMLNSPVPFHGAGNDDRRWSRHAELVEGSASADGECEAGECADIDDCDDASGDGSERRLHDTAKVGRPTARSCRSMDCGVERCSLTDFPSHLLSSPLSVCAMCTSLSCAAALRSGMCCSTAPSGCR